MSHAALCLIALLTPLVHAQDCLDGSCDATVLMQSKMQVDLGSDIIPPPDMPPSTYGVVAPKVKMGDQEVSNEVASNLGAMSSKAESDGKGQKTPQDVVKIITGNGQQVPPGMMQALKKMMGMAGAAAPQPKEDAKDDTKMDATKSKKEAGTTDTKEKSGVGSWLPIRTEAGPKGASPQVMQASGSKAKSSAGSATADEIKAQEAAEVKAQPAAGSAEQVKAQIKTETHEMKTDEDVTAALKTFDDKLKAGPNTTLAKEQPKEAAKEQPKEAAKAKEGGEQKQTLNEDKSKKEAGATKDAKEDKSKQETGANEDKKEAAEEQKMKEFAKEGFAKNVFQEANDAKASLSAKQEQKKQAIDKMHEAMAKVKEAVAEAKEVFAEEAKDEPASQPDSSSKANGGSGGSGGGGGSGGSAGADNPRRRRKDAGKTLTIPGGTRRRRKDAGHAQVGMTPAQAVAKALAGASGDPRAQVVAATIAAAMQGKTMPGMDIQKGEGVVTPPEGVQKRAKTIQDLANELDEVHVTLADADLGVAAQDI